MTWCKDYEEFKKDIAHTFEHDLEMLLKQMIRDGYLRCKDRYDTETYIQPDSYRVSITDHCFEISFRRYQH